MLGIVTMLLTSVSTFRLFLLSPSLLETSKGLAWGSRIVNIIVTITHLFVHLVSFRSRLVHGMYYFVYILHVPLTFMTYCIYCRFMICFSVFNKNVLSWETSMQASGVYICGLMHTHIFLTLCLFWDKVIDFFPPDLGDLGLLGWWLG